MRFASAVVVVVVCASLLCASTAAAQTYVGASVIADVVRVSGNTRDGSSGSGETLGGALRVGTSLGERWGVELEFARSGEIDVSPEFTILGGVEIFFGDSQPLPGVLPGTQIFPPPRITSERQLSTLSTMAWWSQDIGERATLVYLGGVAFTRSELDLSIEYDDFPFPRIPLPTGGLPLPLPISRPSIQTETVSYGADVAVGFEGRIRMTDHLRLTSGVRLQTAGGGWSIRPGVGLQWMF